MPEFQRRRGLGEDIRSATLGAMAKYEAEHPDGSLLNEPKPLK